MAKEFQDRWSHSESLSDEEIEAIYRAAREEVRYRIEMYWAIGLYFLALGVLFMVFQAAVRVYHLGPYLKVAFVALQIVAAGLGVRGLFALNRRLYDRAILRQLRGR